MFLRKKKCNLFHRILFAKIHTKKKLGYKGVEKVWRDNQTKSWISLYWGDSSPLQSGEIFELVQ